MSNTNALNAEWTEQNEEAVREWVRSVFNQDSIVEQYRSDVEKAGLETALFSVYYNQNFADTLLERGITGWQEDVALEEWEASCGLFGIVQNDDGVLVVKPESKFAKSI